MIKIAVDLKYPCGFGQCFGSAMVSMRIRFLIQAFVDQKLIKKMYSKIFFIF
jgi:hypothetical protein